MERIEGSDREKLRQRAAELFGVDLESSEELEAQLAEARAVMAQGSDAVAEWLLEGDERYQELKREIEEYLILEDAKKELQSLINTDPNVAGAVATLSKLARRPGLIEAILAKIDDEETISKPGLNESLAQLDAGEITEIPPQV